MRLSDFSEADIRSAMLYALAALPIGAGVIAATWYLANGFQESDLLDVLGLSRSLWGAALFYLVLPVILGTLAFAPLAWWRTGRPGARFDRLGLFTRTAAIWLMLAALPIVVVLTWKNPDSGLVGPLYVWVWSGIAGGIIADRIALGRRRRHAARAARPEPEPA